MFIPQFTMKPAFDALSSIFVTYYREACEAVEAKYEALYKTYTELYNRYLALDNQYNYLESFAIEQETRADCLHTIIERLIDNADAPMREELLLQIQSAAIDYQIDLDFLVDLTTDEQLEDMEVIDLTSEAEDITGLDEF